MASLTYMLDDLVLHFLFTPPVNVLLSSKPSIPGGCLLYILVGTFVAIHNVMDKQGKPMIARAG